MNLLTLNLTTRLPSLSGETWTPDPFLFGEDLPLALRLVIDDGDGNVIPFLDDVRKVRAMIGLLDERPESGKFALQIGPGAQTSDNTTELLQHDCSPAEMRAAINAKTAVVAAYGNAAVTKEDGSWKIVWTKDGTAGAAEVPVKVRANSLFPVSLGRIAAYTLDAVWTHEVRLTQAPVATVKRGGDGEPAVQRVLPAPPKVTRLIAGGSGEEVNELQRLVIPPSFPVSFALVRGSERTKELTKDDGTAEIEAALVTLLGQGNVKVTDAADFTVHIEFIGDLAGAAQEALGVAIIDPPLGDVSFTIALDRWELLTLLKRKPTVALPLELRLDTVDENGVLTRRAVTLAKVTIGRPLVWPEMDVLDPIDWTRPPSPKNYQLRGDAIFLGDKSERFVVGDGESTTFACDHSSWPTRDVEVWGRESEDNGRQLVPGTDFTARIVDADSVEITALTGAPAEDAWAIYVRAAEPIATFAEGLTVSIDQVTGLEARLAALEGRVGTLEDYVPDNPPALPATGASNRVRLALPSLTTIFPGIFPSGFDTAAALRTGAGLLAAPRLLPAIHEATAASVSTILTGGALPAPSTQVNRVFTNDTGAALHLPAGGGRTGTIVPAGGYVGSDGQTWYRVEKWGTTKSYFAHEHGRRFFQLPVNETMLRAGQTLTVGFDLALALLKPNVESVKALVRIEVGQPTAQSTPATTADNLEAIAWEATPLLEQPIVISSAPETHRLGVAILRASDGSFTANQLRYTAWSVAGTVPPAPAFILRAVLRNLDTPNAVRAPRGFVFADFKPADIDLA